MGFVTKVDLSENRQIKETQRTTSVLSGATQFGIPYSALTSGPDYSSEVAGTILFNQISTFTGTSATTVYVWAQSIMSLGEGALDPLTPTNRYIPQETDSVFSANTTTVIDGNTVVTSYTGCSFDLVVGDMITLAPNLYSGNTTSTVTYLSAGTADYTGRTIWNDTIGIARTEKFIVTDNPTIGYVLTCMDAEGMAEWQPSSGGTTGVTSGCCFDVFVTGGTQIPDGITFANNTGGTFNVIGLGQAGVDAYASTTATGYTLTSAVQTLFIDCTSNDILVTLPNMFVNNGRVFTIIRTDSSVNIGTLTTGGVGTVQGAATLSIPTTASVTVITDGVTGWWIK